MPPPPEGANHPPTGGARNGPADAVTPPRKTRASRRWPKVGTLALQIIAAPQKTIAIPSMRVRCTRSARTPNGTLASAAISDVTVTSSPTSVLLMSRSARSCVAAAPTVAASALLSPRTAARMRITRVRSAPPSACVIRRPPALPSRAAAAAAADATTRMVDRSVTPRPFSRPRAAGPGPSWCQAWSQAPKRQISAVSWCQVRARGALPRCEARHRRRSYAREMATMADLRQLALAMPQASEDVSEDGRPTYSVHGKLFCCHRGRRRDPIDPETGERLEDVLMFRVADLGVKELLLADERSVYFTTPHFDGYPAVLMRIPDLARIDRDELEEMVVEAWLTPAQKRVAKAWLPELGVESPTGQGGRAGDRGSDEERALRDPRGGRGDA